MSTSGEARSLANTVCATYPPNVDTGNVVVTQLVNVPSGDGGTYGIDATEVTRAQYCAWLETTPSTLSQPSYCAWNDTYEPKASCIQHTEVCQTDCEDHPIVCVDWCDAYAYCQSVGKRLCGRIGGGPNDYNALSNSSQSEWYSACVSGSASNAYTYGATYDSQKCNGQDKGVGATLGVATLPNCQSGVAPYMGIYDLSGNVYEWEDSCNGTSGVNDYCRSRGGCYSSDLVRLRCDDGGASPRYDTSRGTGFRCCSDP
jgi:formylglycine-generating enzyme required for sulfatase activity